LGLENPDGLRVAAAERAHALGTLVCGRLTYELSVRFWDAHGPTGKSRGCRCSSWRTRCPVMHHFMWLYDIDADGTEHPRDTGCPSCSSAADGIGKLRQLHVRNTTLVAVSRAPYAKLAAFRERMGWTFPWYSSAGSDFNYDFHATVDDRIAPVLVNYRGEAELERAGMPWSPARRGDYPGISAFLRVGDEVFHTYSTFGRGIEEFHNGDPYLDLTALGRQEAWEEPKGRAVPLGLQVGGLALRLPDEYDT
jgi:predicted dithiol-disulfide oxidoreductase (DUF899 family)